MKTLGQIAREAFDTSPVDYTKTFDKQDAMWEAAARAVQEECAKACEDRWPELHPG